MKWRILSLALAGAVALAATYAFWSPVSRARETSFSTNAAIEQSAMIDRRELDRLIGVFEADAKTNPTSAGLAFLSQMYLQRARSTGDVGTYTLAEDALHRSLQMAPKDVDAQVQLAGLRFTLHDFDGAARMAADVLKQYPDRLPARAVLGDSQLELGQYAKAAAIYAEIEKQQGDVAAVSVRQARLAFLMGDIDKARALAARAKKQANDSAFGDTGLAFYTTFQGQVEIDSGHYDVAAKFYGQALKEAPDYYIAKAGLARSEAAQGHYDKAIALFRSTIDTVPQPDYVAALGDLYALRGDQAESNTQYGTVEAIASLAKANKQLFNRQLAMFYADHDTKVDEAVRLATAELSVRKDVYGYDVLAWSLLKAGRVDEARVASNQALAQGTRDAKLLYHSGMIAKAQGDVVRARQELGEALALNPKFDPIQAAHAYNALAELGVAA